MKGVMVMLDVYNLYLGGYLPKVSPKTNVHNKRELRTKYKSIVSLNNANPLVMVKLTGSTQAYALDVKEMSMELGEAAQDAAEGREGDARKNMQRVSDIFNKLLNRSDEYGNANGRPSRPGGELRNLVDRFETELQDSGISVSSEGFLSVPSEDSGVSVKVPEGFTKQLIEKCDHMSMNPMEYVDKKVYSYAHIFRSDVGPAYESSIYTGMLFNSYC